MQLTLLIVIESPKIFHSKSTKNVGVVLGLKLGLIRCNVVKKSKETGIINRIFSSYFAWEIHFKARSSDCANT